MNPDSVQALSDEASRLDINRNTSIQERNAMYLDYDQPPPPRVFSQGTVATDITQQFCAAASKLAVGHVLKDDFLSLLEAVGALEIMDPKMDSGYLAPGETPEDDYDVARDLPPEEVLGIMDKLLCHEMGWHKGHPLSQTLFTSLYIESILAPKPTRLEDISFNKVGLKEPLCLQILRAYCVALLKICGHVNGRVQAEHYYEEEDFVTHTYNRSLLEQIEDGPALKLLADTRQSLSQAEDISTELKSALDSRLHFRELFLQLVIATEARDLHTLKPLWEDILRQVPTLKSGLQLSRPVPDSFSSKLQRKLASTVPPRPIVNIDFEDAYQHLQKLCQDGLDVTQVLEYRDSQSLMTFVFLFQARKPQPSVYIRTLLQHFLFGEMVVLGGMSVRQILDDDLATIVLPNSPLLDRNNDEIELPHDPRFKMARKMEAFRARAAQSFLDILRTLCQNRCRIRRTLCHTIADWDSLQLDAELVDQELREFTKEEGIVDPVSPTQPIYSYPLSSWAYLYKLKQMEWIVQLGFELEVYQHDELGAMYWYLHYISHTKRQHLERMRGFHLRRAQKALSPQLSAFDNTGKFLAVTMLESTATKELADALSCLYTILMRYDLVYRAPRPYSDDTKRYELRMKPFLQISLPELLPYRDFHLSVEQPECSTQDMIEYVVEMVKRARSDFDMLLKLEATTTRCQGAEESWKANIKNCVKACIATSIAITTVQKSLPSVLEDREAVKKLQVTIPAAEKCYHDWWIVPEVKRVT